MGVRGGIKANGGMMFEKVFRVILTLMVLVCLCMPVIAMFKFDLNQVVAFRYTGLFILYAIIIHAIGTATISAIWEKKE